MTKYEEKFWIDFYEKQNQRMLITYSIIIFFIIIFLTITINIVLRIFLKRPLQRLDTLAKAYGAGNYDYPAKQEPLKEFQRFTTTMQEMGKKILAQMNTIRNTETKFREMFSNASEGIFQISADWKEINLNPAMAEIFEEYRITA